MIQITLEDIQKWWGIIATEMNILLNENFLLSHPAGHVAFECEMAFEIEKTIVQPIKIPSFI